MLRVQVVDIKKLKRHHRDFIVNRALGSTVDQDNEACPYGLFQSCIEHISGVLVTV